MEEVKDDEIIEPTDTEQEDDLSQKVISEEEEGTVEEVDYKSEYERLNGELAVKNERIAKQDKKIIKLKKGEEVEEEPEEKPDFKSLVSKEVQEQMSNFVQDTIDEEIEKATSNLEEQKLIKWYFDNRIVKSGWSKKEIVEYISDAKTLANRNKINTRTNVLAKKAKSDGTAGSPAFAGTPPKPTPKVTEYDRKMAEKFFKGDVKKWMKFKPN